MNINIKTIAEHFNTSVSVVFLAFNDSGHVSAAKRKLIKEYAGAHHNHPFPAAGRLPKKSPKYHWCDHTVDIAKPDGFYHSFADIMETESANNFNDQ